MPAANVWAPALGLKQVSHKAPDAAGQDQFVNARLYDDLWLQLSEDAGHVLSLPN